LTREVELIRMKPLGLEKMNRNLWEKRKLVDEA